jgi:hypothetical protein
MRSKEFITESAKLWSAKVRINQPNYVGYVDAQVWAPNAQIARTILKQQYNIQDHHVGSVKEIKMRANQFVKEAVKLPAGVADQAIQYISGPMLPKPNGQYRFQDVLKRVKEIKDAIARAKQSGRLDVNSTAYKDAMAELKKWADWLEASQAPVQPGTPIINIEEESNHSDTSDMPLTEDRKTELIQIIKNALVTGNIEPWQDLTADEKLSAFNALYPESYKLFRNTTYNLSGYFPKEEDIDNALYSMIKKRQDDSYQIQIGPEKRAELAKMVEELAEMRRQQARKEKLEDEAIAYQRYQDEQQRQDAFKKIEMQYQQELKVINTNHANGMEAIRTGNSHEIQKIELAHGEAERDRDHDLTRLGQQQQHELTMQQQQQAQRESVERIAHLAGVNINEALNPNLGKILELANQFAIAVANMKIYTDDLFANYLKIGGLGSLLDGLKKVYTDQSYASGQREAAKLKQELGKLGVKVDYNESFPTDYTLEIPGQSRPYTFNIIKLLKDAIDGYNSKAVNEDLSRVAELAGVPLKEAWDANMGKIYEAANMMAVAVYDLFILSNPAFRKREDPDGLLYATLQKYDPEDFEDTKELSRRDLADYGAKLTYNANDPRMFTLHVPKMEPYTFDVKEVIHTAVN